MATKKMRTKRVEIDKLLPIYKEGQINLNESGFEHRPVESVETGVEKEEEQEHHLQKVISNSNTDSKAQAYIPTPDASKEVENYNQLYRRTFATPKNYIRFTSTVEHCTGTTYCMDLKDLEWLKAFNQKPPGPKVSEDLFESVIDRIEKYADKKTTNPEDIKIFTIDTVKFDLRIPDVPFGIVHEIFLYWKKRHHDNLYKRILVAPHIKYQTKDNSLEDSDPYICFRGRDSKPVRRTRLVDQNATLKLDNLYNTLQSSVNLVRLVKQREEARHNLIMMEKDIPTSKIKLTFLKRKYNWVDKKHKSLTPVSPVNDHSEYTPIEVKKNKTEHTKTKTHNRVPRPLAPHLPPGISKPRINIPFDYKDDWALLGLQLPHISQSEAAFISSDQNLRTFQAHNILDDEYNISVFNRWRIGRGGRLILDRKPAYVNDFSPFPHDNRSSNSYSEGSLGWVESNVNVPTPDSIEVLSYYDNGPFRKKMITGMNHHHKSSPHQLSTHWAPKYPFPK